MCFRLTLCLLLGLAAICGCSRQQTTNCESAERYATARSVPPVQIPDDLSPPAESDALRLPPEVGAAAAAPSEACLEAPPAFSRGPRPGREPEADDAAAPADAPAVDGERVIEE